MRKRSFKLKVPSCLYVICDQSDVENDGYICVSIDENDGKGEEHYVLGFTEQQQAWMYAKENVIDVAWKVKKVFPATKVKRLLALAIHNDMHGICMNINTDCKLVSL